METLYVIVSNGFVMGIYKSLGLAKDEFFYIKEEGYNKTKLFIYEWHEDSRAFLLLKEYNDGD